MPTLHWIGKEKVINHHRDVPYKVLQHQYGFDAQKGQSKTQTNSGNKMENKNIIFRKIPRDITRF